MSDSERKHVHAELGRLTSEFFRAVSFEPGGSPSYASIPALFIERGLLIENVTSTPEISFVQEFIDSREALVASGTLTRFHEAEISESSVIFGNVAHRFSVYAKSGTSGGKSFETRGMITTQFIHSWWLEDERHGVGRRARWPVACLVGA